MPERQSKLTTKDKILLATGVIAGGTGLTVVGLEIAKGLAPNQLTTLTASDPATATIPQKKEQSLAEFTVTPTPEATLAPASNPEPTKAVPVEGFNKTDKGYEFKTKWGEVVEVPQAPEGLNLELQKDKDGKQKLKFVAAEDNKYGAKKGEELGDFKPLVTTSENGQFKVVGGAVLDPRVTEKLQQEKNQKDKWSVVLPVDLTGIDDKMVSVSVEKSKSPLVSNLGIRVTFPGQVPLINIIPGSSELTIGEATFYNALVYMDTSRFSNGTAMLKMQPGKESMYLGVAGPFIGLPADTKIKSSFGERIGSVQNWVVIAHSAATEADDTDYSKVVRLGNSLVFSKAPASPATSLTPSVHNELKISADGSVDYGNGVIGPSKADQEAN